MRDAMRNAQVGDDVYRDDPTVTELEQLAAKLCGKEAALFCPSGTMANQIAIMALTKRGDEIILSRRSHIVAYEAGAAAVLAGVSYNTVDGGDDMISPYDISSRVRGKDVHFPDTGLVCLENATSSGRVVTIDQMKATYDEAKKHGLPVYLDGARLFNAAQHLGVPVSEIAWHSDALMFCLSKGLGAPAGSILCGTERFIERARRYRKMLGGGMRQAGIIAAAGIYALKNNVDRLAEDHENAKNMAERLNILHGFTVDYSKLDINLIFFTVNRHGFNHTKFVQALAEQDIKINPIASDWTYRFAIHNGITRSDIDRVLAAIRKILSKHS